MEKLCASETINEKYQEGYKEKFSYSYKSNHDVLKLDQSSINRFLNLTHHIEIEPLSG
jgi:hypothetical protein